MASEVHRSSPPSVDPQVGTLKMIQETAATLRRIQANEDYDAKGIRTIWHRGRNRTEMLSWENRDGKIVRQELSLFGLVVEFQQGAPLRTARVPSGELLTSSGRPMSHMLEMDPIPLASTLENASN